MWGQIHCKKSIRGEKAVPETRLDMTCSWSTSWQDKYIGNNALNGPVCGRERPDSHTFQVSVHFSFYKLHSQRVYKHLQMVFTPKHLYFTFTSDNHAAKQFKIITVLKPRFQCLDSCFCTAWTVLTKPTEILMISSCEKESGCFISVNVWKAFEIYIMKFIYKYVPCVKKHS